MFSKLVTYLADTNYDAIEVGVTSEIPCDYPDLMGVPITFMDKYNPDQFEIVGILNAIHRSVLECSLRKSIRIIVI